MVYSSLCLCVYFCSCPSRWCCRLVPKVRSNSPPSSPTTRWLGLTSPHSSMCSWTAAAQHWPQAVQPTSPSSRMRLSSKGWAVLERLQLRWLQQQRLCHPLLTPAAPQPHATGQQIWRGRTLLVQTQLLPWVVVVLLAPAASARRVMWQQQVLEAASAPGGCRRPHQTTPLLARTQPCCCPLCCQQQVAQQQLEGLQRTGARQCGWEGLPCSRLPVQQQPLVTRAVPGVPLLHQLGPPAALQPGMPASSSRSTGCTCSRTA